MAGRKKKVIDWEEVDELLQAGCPGTEIAAYFGMHPDTLYNACMEIHKTDFSAYSQQKKSTGEALLRVEQFKQALNGNVTMQIWLGKQRLGQKEKHDITGTNQNLNYNAELTKHEIQTISKALEEDY